MKKTSYRRTVSFQAANDDDDDLSLLLFEAAKEPLLWESIQAREDKPVLNLSNRDQNENLLNDKDSPQQQQVEKEEEALDACFSLEQWNATKTRLKEMGILRSKEEEENLLRALPQLLRLETSIVVHSCQALVDLFGNDTATMIQQEPQLLSFRANDLLYGVEFLSLMMASTQEIGVETCRTNPILLKSGAQGGLQEQAVKRALGEAASATTNANQRIAANAAASLEALKQARKPPGM